MLNSKQRAQLRAIASSYDTIMQIGKGGIPDTLVEQVKDALRVRELIKLRCLENSEYGPREAAEELAEKTGSEVVAVIGSRLVLYKRNPQDIKIFFEGEKRPAEKTTAKKATAKGLPLSRKKAAAARAERLEKEKPARKYYHSRGSRKPD